MPLPLAIALRYLAASRRRAHVAVISLISIFGLALGVAALIISLALLTGFQDKIRGGLAARTPHLLVLPARGNFFSVPAAVRGTLAGNPDVRSVRADVTGRGWISDRQARTTLPVSYRAVEGSPASPGQIRISASVAGQIGLGKGSRALIASGRTVLSPLGPVPVVLPVAVAGVLKGGPAVNASEVELSLDDARLLASSSTAVSAFEVRLASAQEAPAVAHDLAPRLPPETVVRTWREMNVGLSFALKMEKALIFVTVFLIVLVACLNVVSDLSLLVVEKRRDLGILSTLGADPRSLSRIYWWLGAMIGTLGTATGAAAGILISWSANRYKLVPLPQDVYLMSHVPFALHARDMVLVLLFSLAAAMAAAILPARSAARVGPAEALGLSR